MAGTIQGGRLAAQKNIQRHGDDFYSKIGRLGGKRGRSGGFAAGPEGRKRASYYGAKGGSVSRRSSKKDLYKL
jgi:general stress protein YciG